MFKVLQVTQDLAEGVARIVDPGEQTLFPENSVACISFLRISRGELKLFRDDQQLAPLY